MIQAPEQRTVDVDVEVLDTRGRTLHGYAAVYPLRERVCGLLEHPRLVEQVVGKLLKLLPGAPRAYGPGAEGTLGCRSGDPERSPRAGSSSSTTFTRPTEELVAKGVEFTAPPTERFYGTDYGLRDPFGNHLRMGTPKESFEVPERGQVPTGDWT